MKSSSIKRFFYRMNILDILWRNKWSIIIPLVIIPLTAYSGSFLIQPVYESSVIVWVGETFGLSSGLRQLVGDELSAVRLDHVREDDIRSLKNELNSTTYIGQLAKRLRLDDDPVVVEMANQTHAMWPHLSLDRIKIGILQNQLRERLNIEFSGLDQVKITAQSDDPFRAQNMAQVMGEIFIAEKMKQQLSLLRLAQEFTYGQLDRYEMTLMEKDEEKAALAKELHNVQSVDSLITDENIGNIVADIDGTQREIRNKEEEAGKLLSRISPTPISLYKVKLNESYSLRSLKAEMHQHLERIDKLMLKYRWDSPQILNFNSRLYKYLHDIENEIGRLVEVQFAEYDDRVRTGINRLMIARADMEMLYSRKNQLTVGYTELQNKMGLIPEYRVRLDQMDREIASIREMIDRILQQQESSSISQAILRDSEFKVIQPAQLPLVPLWPDPEELILMAVILALIVGGGVTMVNELTDTSFKRVDDVESTLGVPVIGVIPDIDSVRRARFRQY